MQRYQHLVTEAKSRIAEISAPEAQSAHEAGALIIDVREKNEWDESHIPHAQHVSRGMLELEIEELAPDTSAPIICHCGGGGRSALAAESLQRMGYTKVKSLAGGFNAWEAAGLPTER